MTWITPQCDADIIAQTLIYTVTSAKEAKLKVRLCNRSTSVSATVSIWVVPSAQSVGNEHLVISGVILDTAGMRTAVCTEFVEAPTGAKVYVQASTSNVTCVVTGDETATT